MKWPRGYRFALLTLFLLTLAAIFFITHIRFSNDLRDLLPEDDPAVRTFQEVSEKYGLYTDLYLLLSACEPSPERLMAAADTAAAALRESGLFRTVDARLPFSAQEIRSFVMRYGLLYLALPEVRELLDSFEKPGAFQTIQTMLERYRRRWEDSELFDLSHGYLMTKDGTSTLIVAAGHRPPHDTEYSRKVMEAARHLSETLARTFPGVTMDITGGYAVSASSEAMARSDTIATVLTSLIGVLLLFLVGFRTWQSLPLALIPLTIGMILTFGLAGLAYGKMTVVTMAFAAMLIGLAIDFPIHIYHSMLHNHSSPLAHRSVVLAAQTTTVSFLVLIFAQLPGLRSLGLLSAAGIMICLIVTIILFPYLYSVFHPVRSLVPQMASTPTPEGTPWIGRWGTPVLLAAGGLTVAMSWFAFEHGFLKIPFEDDLSQLRNRNDPSTAAYEKIRGKYRSSFTPMVALVRGTDEDDVLRRCARIREAVTPLLRRNVLSSCRSLSDYIPSRAHQMEVIRLLETVPREEKIGRLKASLDADRVAPLMANTIAAAADSLMRVREPIPVEQVPFLQEVRRRMMHSGPEGTTGIVMMTSRESLAASSHRYALIRELQKEIHPADPDAVLTGLAALGTQLEGMVRSDVRTLTILVAVLIVAMTWIYFRTLAHTAMALLPVALTLLWTIGAMNLFQIKLNNLNILVFPLILGIGVDNGIHLVTRVKAGLPAGAIMSGLFRPMTLAMATTLLGFGSLAFARFTVLSIFGTTMMLALSAAMISSLLVLPALIFRLPSRHGTS